MKLKPGTEAEYAKYKAKNSDPYGGACVEFGEAWADLMEERMARGAAVEQIADVTSHEADKKFGITGFMYGCAVSALSHFWIHGEQLRQWHNLDTQIGTEGEEANRTGGVLNPAILKIGGAA